MYEERYKEFKKVFDELCYRHDKYKVFFDFLKMSAITIQNVFIKDKKLEQYYLNTIQSYNKEEADLFPKLFSILVFMYEEKEEIYDVLGEIYQTEGISNKELGQFFTPFNVSEIISNIVLEDLSTDRRIKEEGYITLSEPTCGAGRNDTCCCKSI